MAAALSITQPAVQYAKKLARQMEREGLLDPYVPLREPPGNFKKLRRHKHKRYQFEALPGYPLLLDS